MDQDSWAELVESSGHNDMGLPPADSFPPMNYGVGMCSYAFFSGSMFSANGNGMALTLGFQRRQHEHDARRQRLQFTFQPAVANE